MDSSPFAHLTADELGSITTHLRAAKMFSLASCVMLFYDMAITFSDEVEKIWKQRFTGATVLWFMNRYLSPLGYIIIIVSFHADWPKSVCNSYVLFPEVLKVFTAFAIGVIFILRLYSIYGKSTLVLVVMTVMLVVQLAVKIWAFTDGTSVELPPGLVGCILTGKSDRIVFTWIAELVFDTVVFFATLIRALVIYRGSRIAHGTYFGAAHDANTVNGARHVLKPSPLMRVMMRDGIIYFLVIFVANVVTVTLFMTLTEDLKVINASFSTLITSLMVSRLILNLRSVAYQPRSTKAQGQHSMSTGLGTVTGTHGGIDGDGGGNGNRISRRASIAWADRSVFGHAPGGAGIVPDRIIGNLGEPVRDWGDDSSDNSKEEEIHRRSLETREMDEFVPRADSSSNTLHLSPRNSVQDPLATARAPKKRGPPSRSGIPERIVVEITTRKDIHRDSLRAMGSSSSLVASNGNDVGHVEQESPKYSRPPPSRDRTSAWAAPTEWRRAEIRGDSSEIDEVSSSDDDRALSSSDSAHIGGRAS